MIRQEDLGPGSFARARKLWKLIREEKVTFAGNRRLKIYGMLHCSSGKKMKMSNRVFFTTAKEAEAMDYRPCGRCLKTAYREWKNKYDGSTSDTGQPPAL